MFGLGQIHLSSPIVPSGPYPAAYASNVWGLVVVANVKDYGAKGDGTNDDTAFIQAAINTEMSIWFPPGTYAVTNTLLPRSGQRIFGLGTIRMTQTNFSVITIANATNVTLEGITVVGNGDVFGGSYITNHNCVNVMNSTNVTVQNCRLSNFGLCGVMLFNSYFCKVINCDVPGRYPPPNEFGANVYLYSGGCGNVVEGCNIVGGAAGIQLLSDTSLGGSGIISNNVISRNFISTMSSYGIADYVGHNVGNTNMMNAILDNTTVNITGSRQDPDTTRPFGAGIYIQSTSQDIVANNRVSRCNMQTTVETLAPGGIGIANTTDSLVYGNTIDQCSYAGIYVVNANGLGDSRASVNVFGNRISLCREAINIEDHGNVNVMGNTMWMNTNAHVIVNGTATFPCPRIAIRGNRMENGASGITYGVHAFANSDMAIEGNTFSSLAWGVYLEATTTNALVTANIFQNSAWGVLSIAGASGTLKGNQFSTVNTAIDHSGLTIDANNVFFNCSTPVAGPADKTVSDSIFSSRSSDLNVDQANMLRIFSRGTNSLFGNMGTALQLENPDFHVGVGSELRFVGRGTNPPTSVYAAMSAPTFFSDPSGTWGALVFSTKFNGFDTNLTERMRITSAGFVGIGNTNPASTLDVIGRVGIGGIVTPTNGVVYPQPGNSAPLAGDIGGSAGSSTNHMLRNVGGSLIDYWSDGSTVWSKQIAP